MAVGFNKIKPTRNLVMKRQIQAHAHVHSNSTQVREHTPIYDLPAYLQRQKKQKSAKLLANIFQSFTFLFGVVLTFSIFLGK